MLGCRLEHGSTWIKWLFREVDGGEEGAGRSYVMVLDRSIPMTLYQYIKLYVFLPVKTPVKKIITPATQQLNILASPVGGRPAPDTVSRDGVVFP
jgi:hypothetical protein